jgi:hypothetical protein
VFLVKQKPVHVLHDITEILKQENVVLSGKATQKLSEYLDSKLEPHSIPFDPKRPGLQSELDNGSRLRDAQARIKKQDPTSAQTAGSPYQPILDKTSRFGGPRNVNESFMSSASGMMSDLKPPVAAKPLENMRPPRDTNASSFDPSRLSPIPPFKPKPAAAGNAPKKAGSDTPNAHQLPTKKDSYEHGPEGMNASFYMPHTSLAFETLLPQVDRSVYEKPAKMEERADDALDVEEPIESAPATIGQTHPDVNHGPSLIPIIKIEEVDPKVVYFTPNNVGTIVKTRPDVDQTPQSDPSTSVIDFAYVSTQSSPGSSGTPGFQFSPEEKKELQDTPNSTPSSQTQDPLTQPQDPPAQSQGPSGSQAIDPADLFQPPTQAGRKRKKKPVETNPRRSARLAAKPARASSATPAPAAAPIPPRPVRNHNVKRGRTADDVDDADDGGGGRKKKVISKTAVEKQRETRRDENAKRGGSGRRSVLERRRV